jgi:ADP-ribose pyrophosphatase YjhB (NUDIX family)
MGGDVNVHTTKTATQVRCLVVRGTDIYPQVLFRRWDDCVDGTRETHFEVPRTVLFEGETPESAAERALYEQAGISAECVELLRRPRLREVVGVKFCKNHPYVLCTHLNGDDAITGLAEPSPTQLLNRWEWIPCAYPPWYPIRSETLGYLEMVLGRRLR